MNYFTRFCLLGVLCSEGALAQNNDDLFEYSLFDLSQLTVRVASYHAESKLHTPAIVTRYDVSQMQAMGLLDLRDMLAFIPGVTVQDHLFGQPFVSVRGVYEGFNQKVLFLLDDTPYFMPSHSDIPLLGLPLAAISHVEVIRGPGAVYYGTNATAGVIKVFTKKHIKEQEVTVMLAEHNELHINGAVEIDRGEMHGLLAASYESSDGYPAHYPAFDTFAQGDINKKDDSQSFLTRMSDEKNTLLLHVFETHYTGIAQPRAVNNVNDMAYKGLMFSVQREEDLNDLHLKIFADYNRFYLNFLVDDFVSADVPGGFRLSHDGERNNRTRAGFNLDYKISDQLSMFFGAEMERRESGAYEVFNAQTGDTTGSIMPSFYLNETSVYGQLDYVPYDAGRLLVGWRYTNNDITGDAIVPRLGFVHSINDNSSFKLLYSVGFNSPSFTQLKADFNGLVNGNEDLMSEQIASIDAGYYFQNKKLSWGITIFRMDAKDFIISDRSSGAIEFFNASNFTRHGSELDVEYVLADWKKIFFNLTYQLDGNSATENDNTRLYAPNWLANSGIIFRLNPNHQVGVSVRYIGERASADSQVLLNAQYQYTQANLNLSATLENGTDADIQNPNMGEFNNRLVPSGQNSNVKLAVKYSF